MNLKICRNSFGIKLYVLMIADIYKMYIKKMNIKNRVYNYYFDNLIKAKKLSN